MLLGEKADSVEGFTLVAGADASDYGGGVKQISDPRT
jgi:hypothetical protein